MTDPIAEGVKLVPELKVAQAIYGTNTFTINRVELETIIAALVAAGEMAGGRQGWKLVPVEPTNEMMEAGDNELKLDYDLGKVWNAMISALVAMEK